MIAMKEVENRKITIPYDIVRYHKKQKVIYALKGEVCTIVKTRGHVLILEKKNGVRFSFRIIK